VRCEAITRACNVDGPRRLRSKDRFKVLTTTLRRRVPVSTFARLVVRTLDPARGSSSACAPSLSPSSSTGNHGRNLRRRSVTMGILSSCEPPNDARFTCVGTGSGLPIFLCEGGCIRYEDGAGHGHARVELRLGVS
jgi:hypothetical protein